ncbi:MAG: hypothetical protein B7X30_05465 [Thiomonas sp. 13-64-67]|nr:MAG: hypothetical protein B7X30_05465 [Thiomonas sp. 13-64-67]
MEHPGQFCVGITFKGGSIFVRDEHHFSASLARRCRVFIARWISHDSTLFAMRRVAALQSLQKSSRWPPVVADSRSISPRLLCPAAFSISLAPVPTSG